MAHIDLDGLKQKYEFSVQKKRGVFCFNKVRGSLILSAGFFKKKNQILTKHMY